MIMRKIVSIVSSSAAKCIDSFPCPLLLRIPLDNGVVARKVGCPLSVQNSTSFQNLDQQMTTVPTPNFLTNTLTTPAFAKHSSLLPSLSQEMSLNIDINKILPVRVSGVCPKSLSRSLILPQSCNVVNPGKMFHSNSVGSPLIPS